MRSACLLALTLPLLGCGPVLYASDDKASAMRAMTFNVSDDDGWAQATSPRRDDVLALIEAEAPDILGVQEALWQQVVDLRVGLPEYDWVGHGRDDGLEAGELGPIFYRRDRYDHVADGTFWLSDTPSVPGSSYADAQVRIATWLELLDHATGRPILILNSHWDDTNEEARSFGASLIVQQLSFLAPDPLPKVVLGDFNCGEESGAMATLRDGGRLDDAWRLAHPDDAAATYHGYDTEPDGPRIDYLMVSTGLFEVDAAEIVATEQAVTASDHFPVVGDLRW